MLPIFQFHTRIDNSRNVVLPSKQRLTASILMLIFLHALEEEVSVSSIAVPEHYTC